MIAGVLDKIAETYGISISASGILVMFLARYGLKSRLLGTLGIFLVTTVLTRSFPISMP